MHNGRTKVDLRSNEYLTLMLSHSTWYHLFSPNLLKTRAKKGREEILISYRVLSKWHMRILFYWYHRRLSPILRFPLYRKARERNHPKFALVFATRPPISCICIRNTRIGRTISSFSRSWKIWRYILLDDQGTERRTPSHYILAAFLDHEKFLYIPVACLQDADSNPDQAHHVCFVGILLIPHGCMRRSVPPPTNIQKMVRILLEYSYAACDSTS